MVSRLGWRNGARALADIIVAALIFSLASACAAHAEPLKIGAVKIAAVGPIYIAVERGYFAAEGLEAEIVYFDAAEPIAVAAASGAIDFGVTGVSAGLYNLAGQGALKIVAAQAHEAKGYQVNGFIVSNAAFDDGLTSFKALAGHSIAVAQIGSPLHYAAALVAMKYGIALTSLRFLPLQANANILTAVAGGRADTGVVPATALAPVLARGQIRLLGWIGDETPWQSSAIFTASRTVVERADFVHRFLTAFRRGTRDYHAAFSADDGTRRDGPAAPEILAILAKYTGQSEQQLRTGIAYIDAEGRIDLADMQRQIAWFTDQRMLKNEIPIDAVIDRASVIPLPARLVPR
jgi:NitT/TauT family transport system substrate-binding protein